MMLIDNLKVKSFIQAAPFESRLINTFFLKLGNEPDETLYRINPLLFAHKHDLDEKQVVDIFILAARAGIFNLFFNLVCPACGFIIIKEASFTSLNKADYFCAVCHSDIPVILDDTIEVFFQIHPAIYKVEFNPFENVECFTSFFFSRSFYKTGSIIGHIVDDLAFLSPGEMKIFKLNVQKDMLYRFIAINLNLSLFVYIGNKQGHNNPLQVTVNKMGFSQKKVSLNRGEIKIALTNDSEQKLGIGLVKTSPGESHSSANGNKLNRTPFLSGKLLFNNTTFRNLFKIKNLPGNLKLKLRSLTLLFMEIQSSPDLYERQGDAFVYDLIQKHFYILEEIADRYQGAIIKTMGDVIMFSFPSPINSLLAAFSMLKGIKSVKHDEKTALCLKIGLHEGHALVINRDDLLDYFGRTVTIAAYLKNLAGPDEIFFSDALFRDKEIKKEFVKLKDRIKLYKKHIKVKWMINKLVIYKMVIIHN
ncbi:MAG: adenylate/guanylate cyclase domain-containing protein [Spirochaetales bacterium]|nr:adenylate/guanylate cyclase domain-containing protein [Spirochaetales bacterium]